ncbi:MAG: hypothetical protein QM817_26755 [Archangium sp.]
MQSLVFLITAAGAAMSLDASFPLVLGNDTHFPLDAKTKQVPLDAATVTLLQLGDGEWSGLARVKLGKELVGYVAAKNSETRLVVFDSAKKRVTDSQVVAAFSKLEGAYEKGTSSDLVVGAKKITLTVKSFLRDFEFEDPSVPGTKNISGGETRVLVLRGSVFSR